MYNVLINCKPHYPRTGKYWNYRGNRTSLVLKFHPIMRNLITIYFLTQLTFTSENWTAIQTHAVRWFNTKTHDMIYSMYCACVHLNCRYYTMDQIPNMVPGDCWGFSRDVIWKAVSEVGNLTEVHGQISYYPEHYRPILIQG